MGKTKVAQKFRIYPNKKQLDYLNRAIGHSRFIWNWALGEWNAKYSDFKDGKTTEKPGWRFLDKKFTEVWRKDFPWINEVDAHTIRRQIKVLGTAWSNYFKGFKNGSKTGKPKFKKRKANGAGSFYVSNQCLKLQNNKVKISHKIPLFGLRQDIRYKDGHILGSSVSFDGNRWFICIQYEIEQTIANKALVDTSIGIDLGIANAVATSNGDCFNFPDVSKIDKKIIREQRKLSRKWSGTAKKGHKALLDENGNTRPKSNRYKKQAKKLAKLYQRKTDILQNARHNITNKITKESETIFLEDLKIKQITKRKIGSGRKTKSKLINKPFLENAPYEIKRQLEYKSKWNDGNTILVNPAYTSQRCPKCSYTSEENRQSQELFVCVSCGFTKNADIVGAMNIEYVGKTGHKLSPTKDLSGSLV